MTLPKPEIACHGIVHAEMFMQRIAIFTSVKTLDAALKDLGAAESDVSATYPGAAGWRDILKPTVFRFYFLVVNGTRPPIVTRVHETTHIIDFIAEYVGLDPAPNGTETRAYLAGHIMKQLLALFPKATR